LFYFPFHMDATMVNLLWVKNVMLLQKHSTLITYRIAYLLVVTLQTAAGGICHLSDDSCFTGCDFKTFSGRDFFLFFVHQQ